MPDHCEHPYHLFYLILHSMEERQALIAHLKRRGINTVFHYVPLHVSGMGRRFGGKTGDCPVTESVSERLVRLPFYNDITEAEQESIIRAVVNFRL